MDGGYSWIQVGVGGAIAFFVIRFFWQLRQESKIERRIEAGLEPSMRTEGEWTQLDSLALDIARHETIARWNGDGRSIFRDVPVRDLNIEGGWDFSLPEWGVAIGDHYESVFREIRGLPPKERDKRLKTAEETSIVARAAVIAEAKRIDLPPGVPAWTPPAWMALKPTELKRI